MVSSCRFLFIFRFDGWRFTVAYGMLAVLFLGLEVAQRKHWIKEQETEPDDLSSLEWAEWKRINN